MEESLEIDIREEVERLEERTVFETTPSWTRYLAVSTVIIAVVAAVASLMSGTYSNEAMLAKNDATLLQNKASDQWSYYQAKGVKKNIADAFSQQFQNSSFASQSTRYTREQTDIQKQAREFETQVEEANKKSERALEKHHHMAFAVTFFQIAIALSALSSLMKLRAYFFTSLLFAAIGTGYMLVGLMSS